jgi:type I restriction enzyme S subunit
VTQNHSLPLRDVVSLNPANDIESISLDDELDFFPMSVVEAGSSVAAASETRPFGAVKKGYTCFADGDVLLAKITPCFENGKIAEARVRSECAFGSTEFHVLRPNAQKLDARYLVNFLRRDQILIEGERRMTGSGGQRRVPKHFLESLRIPLPDLAEQRRIAAILDKADSLRTKRRKAMTYLDGLAQSIFAEMFGHPIENPKRYPTESLVDACHCYSGGTPSKSNESLWDGDLPWYSAKDLKHNDLFDSQDHINRSVTQTTNLKLLPSNTVAIVVRGMILAHTFPVCVLRTESTINQDLKALIPKLSINAQYLAFCLRAQASHILQQVSEAGHGTKRLDTEALRNITVMLPSLELQEEFAARIAAIEKLSRSHQSAQDGLKSLFRSLQHCAFTRTL